MILVIGDSDEEYTVWKSKFWLGEVIENLMYFKILSNGLDCIGFRIRIIKYKWPMLVCFGICGLFSTVLECGPCFKRFFKYIVFSWNFSLLKFVYSHCEFFIYSIPIPFLCFLYVPSWFFSSLSYWIVLKDSQLRINKFQRRKISWKVYICKIFWVFQSLLVNFLLFLTIVFCFNSLLVLKGSTQFIITRIRHRHQMWIRPAIRIQQAIFNNPDPARYRNVDPARDPDPARTS